MHQLRIMLNVSDSYSNKADVFSSQKAMHNVELIKLDEHDLLSCFRVLLKIDFFKLFQLLPLTPPLPPKKSKVHPLVRFFCYVSTGILHLLGDHFTCPHPVQDLKRVQNKQTNQSHILCLVQDATL